jgi:hypothetical protein
MGAVFDYLLWLFNRARRWGRRQQMRLRQGKGERLTADELDARLRFFIGLILGVCLVASVLTILYSLIWVSQPMEQAPNDAEFFKILTPTISFLTGALSGVMIGSGASTRRRKKDEADSSE